MPDDVEAQARQRKQVAEDQARERKQAERDKAREHELRLEKIKLYAALITAAGTIAVALITALVKSENVGAKVNAQAGTPVTFINNVVVGVKTLSNLSNPDQPLSAAIPAASKPSLPTPAPSQITKPDNPVVVSAPAQIDQEAVSTNPDVLKSCYGLGPLKVERVRVEPVSQGYEISLRLRNPGTSTESLDVAGPIKLSDSRESVEGRSNVGGGAYFAGSTTNQKELEILYTNGDMIGPGDATAVNLSFGFRGSFVPAKSVTFGATLLHFTKTDDGRFARQNTSMTCQEIPVLPSAK